jgi:DNA replication protein DnaC
MRYKLMEKKEPETIKDILERFQNGRNILDPKNSTEREESQVAKESLLDSLRKDLNVSSLEHTFENFKLMPGTETSFNAFHAIATGDNCRPFLFCYGGVGNGKSFLCEALVIEWYKRRIKTRIYEMYEIMGVLKRAMNDRNEMDSPDTILSRYCRMPRLIIDDVGMGGSGSPWEYGQLEQIVNARYKERLITVLTTNRDPTELPERIYSRLCDPEIGVVVLNEGEDYRRR